MPELAEVEFNRKQWSPGIGSRIARVDLHPRSRIFREVDPRRLERGLAGRTLVASEAHGKRIRFRFTSRIQLGLHLGMTGKLWVASADFTPAKHDHLVLRQGKRSLVFSDMRQFGCVQFHEGAGEASWWSDLPPAPTSSEFTPRRMKDFLQRHGRLPLKAALLLQEGFPGVGNWMADEILWRAGIHPRTPAAHVHGADLKKLWKAVRFVSQRALATVGRNDSDPPAGWLFHQRWEKGGRCPKDGSVLRRETVGGRTTAWCPRCQHS
jgi:formamidopyrimidine-DNA glycosylase